MSVLFPQIEVIGFRTPLAKKLTIEPIKKIVSVNRLSAKAAEQLDEATKKGASPVALFELLAQKVCSRPDGQPLSANDTDAIASNLTSGELEELTKQIDSLSKS